MSAINKCFTGQQGNETNISVIQSLLNKVSWLSDILWPVFTFFLFVLLGPFSVIAVIIGLMSLGSAENREKMVEPSSC